MKIKKFLNSLFKNKLPKIKKMRKQDKRNREIKFKDKVSPLEIKCNNGNKGIILPLRQNI